jgi:hypothetical protein
MKPTIPQIIISAISVIAVALLAVFPVLNFNQVNQRLDQATSSQAALAGDQNTTQKDLSVFSSNLSLYEFFTDYKINALTANVTALWGVFTTLDNKYTTQGIDLSTKYTELNNNYITLNNKYTALASNYTILQNEYNTLYNQVQQILNANGSPISARVSSYGSLYFSHGDTSFSGYFQISITNPRYVTAGSIYLAITLQSGVSIPSLTSSSLTGGGVSWALEGRNGNTLYYRNTIPISVSGQQTRQITLYLDLGFATAVTANGYFIPSLEVVSG